MPVSSSELVLAALRARSDQHLDETIDWSDREHVEGFDIGYSGWSYAEKIPVTWSSGVRIKGRPRDRETGIGRTVVTPKGLDETTCRVDGSARLVWFQDLEFRSGKSTGPFLGPSSSNVETPKHLTVVFERCTFANMPGTIAKWMVMGYQVDVYFIDCDTEEGTTTYEHFLYIHGLGHLGRVFFLRSAILGNFAEICKITARPRTNYYFPEDGYPPYPKHAEQDGMHPYGDVAHRGLVAVLDSYFEGWAWPGAFHGGGGGGGVILQGPGQTVDLWVKGSVLKGNNGHAIGVEVMSEWFGDDFHGQVGIGCGHVVLEDSLFLARKDPSKPGASTPPLVRIHGAQSAIISRCGLYGDGTKCAVPEDMSGRLVHIAACNTQRIHEFTKNYGYQTDDESVISMTGRPVSEGLTILPDIGEPHRGPQAVRDSILHNSAR